MKRLLAFILVVAMALAFAGSASAFSWEKPAQPTPEEIGYSIDVLKCTLVTGAAGSYYYNLDDNAVAVNGADVYWAVKLTVDNPSNQIKSTAYADVEISGLGLSSVKAIPLSGLDSGVYYFMPSGAGGYFQKIETIIANGGRSPVQATRCTDTQTAKVTARVYSERMMEDAFNVGDYDVRVRPLLNQANILTYIEDYEENYQKGETGGWSRENSVIMRQDDPDNDIYYIDTDYTMVKEAIDEHWKPPLYEEDDKVKQALEENFLAVYNGRNPSSPWDPARQFRIAGEISTFSSSQNLREHIFVIGGYPIILKLANGAYTSEDIAKMLYEKLQSKLGELRNANGQPIPGLTVSLEETPYTTTCCYIVFSPFVNTFSTEENTSYVFTFSADSSYNWEAQGNNIVAQKEYKTYYNADESERTMLVTFYQAASPVGSGPAIAQFVLNGDRQVQAVLTSEAAWEEYLEKTEHYGNGWKDQCPNFLGDMDAIFDLMAWLDDGEIDSIYEAIEAGEMYMTDENLWEALGYAYRFEDSVSWQASTVPIIVDPLA